MRIRKLLWEVQTLLIALLGMSEGPLQVVVVTMQSP